MRLQTLHDLPRAMGKHYIDIPETAPNNRDVLER